MKKALVILTILFVVNLSTKAQDDPPKYDTVKCFVEVLIGENLKVIPAYAKRAYVVTAYSAESVREDSTKPYQIVTKPMYSTNGYVTSFLGADKKTAIENTWPEKQPHYIIKNW